MLTKQKSLPTSIFVALSLNLAIAPGIYASNQNLDKGSAYAIGLLILLVVGLSIYLAMVIIQPEKF